MSTYINYSEHNIEINYNVTKNTLIWNVSNENAIKYLKGIFKTKESFKSHFIDKMNNVYNELKQEKVINEYLKDVDIEEFNIKGKMDELLLLYDEVNPFTYREVFTLYPISFQTLIIDSIDISKIVSELGHTKHSDESIELIIRKYDEKVDNLVEEPYIIDYEIYKVDGTKIGIHDELEVIKFISPSINKTHWFWKDENLL